MQQIAKDVLDYANHVQNDSQQLKDNSAKAKQAWEERADDFEDVQAQVDELDQADDQEAPKFLQETREVLDNVQKKFWDRAGKGLDVLMTEVQTAHAQHVAKQVAEKAYRDGWKRLEPLLKKVQRTAVRPDDWELRQEMMNVDGDRLRAVNAGDFQAALTHLSNLEVKVHKYLSESQELAEPEFQQKQQEFAERENRVNDRLQKILKNAPADDAEVVDFSRQLKVAQELTATDVARALSLLSGLEIRLEIYEVNLRLDSKFADRAKEAQARLEELKNGAPAGDEDLKKLTEQYNQMKSLAGSDIAQAAALLTKLEADMEDYADERQRQQILKSTFEGILPTIEDPLAAELSNPPAEPPELADLHRKLVAAKQEMDEAVKSKDFEAAIDRLETLSEQLNNYRHEKGKEPIDWRVYQIELDQLFGRIDRWYTAASGNLKNAARAYGKALDAYRKTLTEIDERDQYGMDIVKGIFFAVISGGLGGVISGGMIKFFEKKAVLKAAEKFALNFKQRAMIGASTSVASYTINTFKDVGEPAPDDPLAGLEELGGSDEELFFKFGERLDQEKVALLDVVDQLREKFKQFLKENKAFDAKIREYPPLKALKDDPFLNVLRGLKTNSMAFAKVLWGLWIQEHAYKVKQDPNKWFYFGEVEVEDELGPMVLDKIEEHPIAIKSNAYYLQRAILMQTGGEDFGWEAMMKVEGDAKREKIERRNTRMKELAEQAGRAKGDKEYEAHVIAKSVREKGDG